jgi:hypothetical protein
MEFKTVVPARSGWLAVNSYVSNEVSMDDFTQFLRKVGEKPGFYLAPDSSGQSKSISHLKTFITGIQVGQHLKTDIGALDGFTEWVCHRYGIAMSSIGWSGLILKRAGGDEAAAFQLFFVHLEEYLREREQIGCEAIKARYLEVEQKYFRKIT